MLFSLTRYILSGQLPGPNQNAGQPAENITNTNQSERIFKN